MSIRKTILGSARGSRAGFGVAPKRSSLVRRHIRRVEHYGRVRDREDVLASTRAACAPRIPPSQPKWMFES